MKAELYDTDRRLHYAVKGLEDSSLSENNVQELKKMKLELQASNRQGDHRVSTVLSQFSPMAELIDFDLATASKKQLMQLVKKINRDEIGEQRHSVWTLCEYKKALKAYYSWKTGEEHPSILDFMHVHPRESEKPKIQKEELLDVRQVEEMVNAASNPRDKVFLGMLWDTGARISELLNLRWKDIIFKGDLMATHIRHGKNGPRKLFLVESQPLLRNWQSWCASKGKPMNPEDPVFTVYRPYRSTDILTYRNARKQINAIRERVDLPSRIKTNPHAWRKARATDMAGRGMTQPNMNAWFGWAPGSNASGYYIRLAARDLEKQVRDIYPGLEPLPEQQPKYLGENIPIYDQSDLRAYGDLGMTPG